MVVMSLYIPLNGCYADLYSISWQLCRYSIQRQRHQKTSESLKIPKMCALALRQPPSQKLPTTEKIQQKTESQHLGEQAQQHFTWVHISLGIWILISQQLHWLLLGLHPSHAVSILTPSLGHQHQFTVVGCCCCWRFCCWSWWWC